MIKHLFIAIVSIFVLSACLGGGGSSRSHGGAKPDWVMKPKKSEQFLYGVGSAKNGDRESAKNEAKSDLVSQIRVGGTAVRTQNTLLSSQKTADSMVERLDRKVDEVIKTDVNIADLPGIEVEEEKDMGGVTYVL